MNTKGVLRRDDGDTWIHDSAAVFKIEVPVINDDSISPSVTVTARLKHSFFPEPFAHFPSRELAIDALDNADIDFVFEALYAAGQHEGQKWPEMRLALEICPTHGWGLLAHDDGCTWIQLKGSLPNVPPVDEIWGYDAYGHILYLVAHIEGAQDKSWQVWRVQDDENAAKQVVPLGEYSSRHCAVAFVESLRDEIVIKVPWAHETTEYCCNCHLEVSTEPEGLSHLVELMHPESN